MNELIWLLSLAGYFALVILMYRYLGVAGLLAWIPMATILANLEVLKLVPLFGIPATTLGNIPYATTFLATDILSENHGKHYARKAVIVGFVAILATLVAMNVAMVYQASPDDTAQPHFEALFGILPRLALGSVLAYVVSQFYDVWAYEKIRALMPKTLWLRNNGSTLVSQFLDTAVFCTVAFLGDLSMDVFWQVLFSTYVIKALVALLDTPLVYLAKHLYNKGKIPATAV